MEIEGHPSHDIVEELERRGAAKVPGSAAGPRLDAIRFLTERIGEAEGFWIFLPREAFMTGMDDPLP